jgi:hypothetical protein
MVDFSGFRYSDGFVYTSFICVVFFVKCALKGSNSGTVDAAENTVICRGLLMFFC